MPSVSINATSLKTFSAALRREQPALRTRMLRQLRVAGKLVADEAKDHGPKQAKFSVSTAAGGVTVTVKGPPIVGLLENGSSGSSNASSWRHPTYGHDPWVTQPTHPYLAPALEAKREEALVLILEAVDETVIAAASGL